jgi:hypothetical protein
MPSDVKTAGSIVGMVYLRHDPMVTAHLFKLMNSIKFLVHIQIDLKYKMNEASCRINKDSSTIKHLGVRCLSYRSEKMALGSTYKVVKRDVLSSKETAFLQCSLMILHHT